MKRHIRIALSVAGFAMLGGLYSVYAAAQIATPVVSAIPGAEGNIPFDLYRGNRIVLPGRINGTATDFLLDSGAGVTTIDRDFARQIGLKKGIEITAQGAGGVEKAELVQDVTLEAGNLKLSGVSVAVIDLDSVEKAIGRPVPVILGRELFVNSVVGLDFDRNLLTLSPTKNFVAPAGATEVKVRRDGRLFVVPVAIDGLPQAEAILDIGNGGALSISKEYHEANPKLRALPYAVGFGGGVGGLHEIRRVSLPTLEFAGYTFRSVPTDLGGVADGPYEGRANVGIQMLRPFNVTLDLGNDRMWLKRTGKPVDFPKDRAGLFMMLEDDHFNVLHVSPGSPADKAGLKKGDRLVAVAGQPIGPGFYSSAAGDWARGPAGTQVPVTKGDGQTVILTLANYY